MCLSSNNSTITTKSLVERFLRGLIYFTRCWSVLRYPRVQNSSRSPCTKFQCVRFHRLSSAVPGRWAEVTGPHWESELVQGHPSLRDSRRTAWAIDYSLSSRFPHWQLRAPHTSCSLIRRLVVNNSYSPPKCGAVEGMKLHRISSRTNAPLIRPRSTSASWRCLRRARSAGKNMWHYRFTSHWSACDEQ